MKRILFAMLISIAASSFALSQDSRPIPPIGPIGPPRGSYPPSLPIVFISNRDANTEIYRMNPDGSAPQRLTYKVEAEDRDPRLSPDGRRIAFSTNRDGNYEIYVMKVDGSSQTRLTNNPGEDSHPYWSPDGSRIIFARVTPAGRIFEFSLLIMNADGTGERLITRDGRNPAWSPDGGRIAFLAFESFPGGITTTQIYSMNVDGSGRRRLTVSPTTDANHDWSPDSTRIVFSRDYEIWVMNAGGGGQSRLSVGTHPAWSRDGRRIAFIKGPDDTAQIYLMNADGSSQTRISDSAGWNYQPDW